MGGKSRKSGGVSKNLINIIKQGDSKNKCGTKKPKDEQSQKTIFDKD